ncbi:MAG TPA: hypothetical protein VM364_09240 [Vicinamibacterales bacterium]|nr:hypothetical protein [Vicinamibacterales bacterium]
MNEQTEKRQGPDRRRRPRGGRRPGDVDGFAPLVLLVGDEEQIAEGSDAILARLKFAVATSRTVDEALRILPDLRPDLIVASERDADAIRAVGAVPVVLAPAGDRSPERLTDRVLQTLRADPVY